MYFVYNYILLIVRTCKILYLFIIQIFPETRGGIAVAFYFYFLLIRQCLLPFPGLN